MFKVKKNTITITQGDTLVTTVEIEQENGEPYVPDPEDRIRFALKSDYSDAQPLIIKQIDNDTLELRLEATETKTLQAREKPYVYDIQMTYANGDVDTFIDRAKFYVTEEVD